MNERFPRGISMVAIWSLCKNLSNFKTTMVLTPGDVCLHGKRSVRKRLNGHNGLMTRHNKTEMETETEIFQTRNRSDYYYYYY